MLGLVPPTGSRSRCLAWCGKREGAWGAPPSRPVGQVRRAWGMRHASCPLARRAAWRGVLPGAVCCLARRAAWRGVLPGAACCLARRAAWRGVLPGRQAECAGEHGPAACRAPAASGWRRVVCCLARRGGALGLGRGCLGHVSGCGPD